MKDMTNFEKIVASPIKIGWKEYDIDFLSNIPNEDDDTEDCYGEIHYTKDVINISTKYNESQQKVTTLHEILHGISTMYDIRLSEDKICRLANAIAITLKDNKLHIIRED